jgi:hypothetical protein
VKAAPAPAGARTVAYLVNVYPAPSHSFIRREIAALEAAGWRVHRFSHRRGEAACVDPADQDEQQRTRVLVETPRRSALAGVACVVARRPLAAVAAFAQALRMARRGDGRLVAHAGYFVLACVLGRSMGALECRHVHAHFGTNPAAVALLVHFLFGASYSLTFHGPHEFVTPDRLSLDDKIAHASFVAVVSVTGRRAIDARYPGQASKVVLCAAGSTRAGSIQNPRRCPARIDSSA